MSEKRRGKIKKAPAPEIVKYLARPAMLSDFSVSYQAILDINKAHVVMLAEEGIIKKDAAGAILKVQRELAKSQDNLPFEIASDSEDAFFLMERYLIEQTSLEIGGQQHTARSRNDIGAAKARIDIRNDYLQLSGMFLELRSALLVLGREHVDTVMSGYTHCQPSEPITFGHYCSAILNAMERDYARVSRSWDSLNICPLGACAMAGTTFPINRETVAKLLGFDDCMENSLDAVASRDFALELLGALAMAANTFSRMAQDFYIWATPEFNYIEVDDSLAVCSSIMPQKKNPTTLESVKAKAGQVEGFWVGVFSALKNIIFSMSRDLVESLRFYQQAMLEMEASMALLTATVKTLTLKKEHMVGVARENFCTVTELANYLVRYDGYSFRAAHDIVALIVDHMQEHSKKASEVRREDVNAVCMQLFSRETALTDEQIAHALDPALNARSKKVRGGPAPEEVRRQFDVLEKNIEADTRLLDSRRNQVRQAKADLESRLDALIG